MIGVHRVSEDYAIEVSGLGKRFRRRSGGMRTLKSTVLDAIQRRDRRASGLWALKDVSFTVKRGETLGIIGSNGAGKSTFLSIVGGSMCPTEGEVRRRGTVSALLELGAGFHPDLTGRENVFLNGAIMGLSRKVMKERFDAIVAFAGLEKFIDEPVKHYSSGMYVRLGFAVAVEVDPDILLIDEVLAVGDAAFQRKCIQRIDEFQRRKKTMLIVSHDLGTIQALSDRIMLLHEGGLLGIGKPHDVISQYQAASREGPAEGLQREWGTGQARIVGVDFLNEEGNAANTFDWGKGLTARIRYRAKERIEDPVFGFSIADAKGSRIYGNNTQLEGFTIPFIDGEGEVRLRIDRLDMAGGDYLFSFSLHSPDHRTNYHRLDNCFPVTILCGKTFEGTYMPCRWSVGKP